jgi:hypothetical protein
MLLLRTCDGDMKSGKRYLHLNKGFQWPASGSVECNDWDAQPICGFGLHGLPWGEGKGDLLNWDADAKWIVWEAPDETVVAITRQGGGKSKAQRGQVVYAGDMRGAHEYLLANGGAGRAIVGLTALVGDGQVVQTGYRGTATAGDRGTATAGDFGTATAGNFGTATAGYRGTATAGNFGTATAGNGGIIELSYSDSAMRLRKKIGYIGEDGLLPEIAYRLESGIFVPVKPDPVMAVAV